MSIFHNIGIRIWVVVVAGMLAIGFPVFGSQIQEIRYAGLGNYKALLSHPTGKPPFPAVIYVYDQFVDWNGMKFAAQVGYDLSTFATYFADNGYVAMIPIERYRKLDSLKSAVTYLTTVPFVDPKRIYMVGMSEGAFLTLLTVQVEPGIRAAVVINPRVPNASGHFSMQTILKAVPQKRSPILFYMSAPDTVRSRSDGLHLFHHYRQHGAQVYYFERNVGPKWFWSPKSEFLTDMRSVLR